MDHGFMMTVHVAQTQCVFEFLVSVLLSIVSFWFASVYLG